MPRGSSGMQQGNTEGHFNQMSYHHAPPPPPRHAVVWFSAGSDQELRLDADILHLI